MEDSQTNAPDDDVRSDAQLFLAQLHGVLHRIIVQDGDRDYVLNEAAEEDWRALLEAYLECEGFGQAQDALNSGEVDETLVRHAMDGKQGRFKFRGWLSRLRDFYRRAPSLPSAMRALGWANGILESLTGIPGVAQIKEITGLLERLLAEPPADPNTGTSPP